MDRRARIFGPVDPATARGLEIGPLDKAIVRRERGQQSARDLARRLRASGGPAS